MRNLEFETGEYYHIYNRGVDRRNIFIGEKDYVRFIRSMREFNRCECIESFYKLDYLRRKEGFKEAELPIGSSASCAPLVDFVCYCLNRNHYHFLLRQKECKGIEKFMHKLGTSYTKYFNFKYHRSGSLFQGRYKSIHVDSPDYLIQLSCYINSNPEVHGIAKAESWPWSSYLDYLNIRKGTICNKNIVLNDFDNVDEYKKLVNYLTKDSQNLKSKLKQYMLE